MFHKPLNIAQTMMALITQPFRHFDLPIKTQSIFTALGDKMKMTPHGPKEIFAFLKQSQFRASECSLLGQLFR